MFNLDSVFYITQALEVIRTFLAFDHVPLELEQKGPDSSFARIGRLFPGSARRKKAPKERMYPVLLFNSSVKLKRVNFEVK